MGRARLWIAAGALIRDNRGGQTDWYTTCSQPSFPRGCDYAKTTRRATSDTTTPRFAGGVDVNLAKGVAIFASLVNVEDGPALQTGLRLAVRTTEDVVGTRVKRAPSLPPRLASARLAAGQTVWIRTDDGAEHQGLLLNVSQAEFQLRWRGATESIPFDRIAAIERPDPLANGMRNGAIIGVLSGLGLAIGTGLFGGGGESPATGEGAALTLAGLGAGTLAGAAIDALTQRREVVYDARTSGRLTLRTIPMSGGGALRVQLRW